MKELRQRLLLRLMTLLTLSACFSLLAVGGLGVLNFSNILTYWGKDVQITAYLSSELAPSEIERLRRNILKEAPVEAVTLVTQEEALEEFRVQMASYAPDLAQDQELMSLIPASFQISLKDNLGETASASRIEAFAEKLRRMPGLEEVRFGQEWVKKYAAFLGFMRKALLGISLVVLLVTFFVIGNSVRASVESRRFEVEVLELVGATPWMIRKPFLVEGAALGFFSSGLALVLAALALWSVRAVFRQELQFFQLSSHLNFFSVLTVVAFLLIGVGLGSLASYLCVRRINSGFAAAGGPT